MKVLHVYKSFLDSSFGGVEKYIENVTISTQPFKTEHVILCTNPNKDFYQKRKNIEIISYKRTFELSSCPVSLKMLWNFKKFAEKADIIHFQYPWPFAALFTLFTKKKCIMTYQSDIVRQKFLAWILYPLDQIFLNKMDRIIATSPNYHYISNNLKKHTKKVSVIPIAINEKNYPSPQKNEVQKIKKKFGKFFLFIGQFRHYKNLHNLVKATKDVKANVVLLGDGILKPELEKLSKEYKNTNLYFIGSVNEQSKVNFLSACLCLILPSNSKAEAFGISLLEGSMFSKPLISCSIDTGVEFVNKHNETGLVVEPTAEELAKAMNFIATNESFSNFAGKNARKRFESVFNYDSIGGLLFNLYNDLKHKK